MMRPSTKHALGQRFIALLGFTLFMGPARGIPLARHTPVWMSLFGLGILFFAILSASGVGPWGKRYKNLHLTEEKTSRAQISEK